MSAMPWTCPTCRVVVSTPHCPTCGEKQLQLPRDLSLRSLLKQAAHAVSSVDGRVARSFREVAIRPGVLTLAYLQGRRKPYLGPFQLFLVANVMFFALQSFTGARTFSTPLESHLHQQDWSALAQSLLARHLDAAQLTFAEYAPVFDQAIATHAKSLIIFMTVPLMLVLAILFLRKRQPWVAHAVFALHFYTFLLLVLCAGSVAAMAERLLHGVGLASTTFDHVLSAVLLLACAVYLYVAIGEVYQARRAMRLVQAALLAVAVALIFMGYRFALLPLTLWTT